MAKTKSTKKTAKNIKKLKPKPAKSPVASKKAAASPRKAAQKKPSVKPVRTKVVAAAKQISKKTSPVKEKAASTPIKSRQNLSPREKSLQQIKKTLLKQKESLLNEAESALNELPGQTIFPDLGDQASAETDRNFMLRLRGREQRLLKKIEEAIDRIDSGTFGICDDCGNEIDIKRLVARPVTTMCIECKTLQEEEEKLRES